MNKIIKKNGVSYGIVAGVVGALITASIYAIDLNLFAKWWINISIILIYITIGIILLSKTKKELKGVFAFKEAFTTYFISGVVATLISVEFNILLFNVIDPSAKDTLNEILIKSTAETLEKFGTPAAAISETVTKMQESNPYSTIEILKGSIFSLGGTAFFGLLLALIFKSKSTQE
jgi:Protein of unknown function (DUF4199)